MNVSLRPAARADIAAAIAYLNREAPDAAARFREVFMHALETIEENPHIGAPLPFPNPLLSGMRRFFLEYDYFIFYLPFSDEIEIIRVLHARRDLKDIFS